MGGGRGVAVGGDSSRLASSGPALSLGRRLHDRAWSGKQPNQLLRRCMCQRADGEVECTRDRTLEDRRRAASNLHDVDATRVSPRGTPRSRPLDPRSALAAHRPPGTNGARHLHRPPRHRRWRESAHARAQARPHTPRCRRSGARLRIVGRDPDPRSGPRDLRELSTRDAIRGGVLRTVRRVAS